MSGKPHMEDRLKQPNSRHLVAADLRGLIEQMPPIVFNEEVLPDIRSNFGIPIEFDEDEKAVEQIKSERLAVPGRAGDPDVAIALHLPRAVNPNRGAILHIHGGGYVAGDAFSTIPIHRKMALDLDCVIASVDYRLAPETRFPGAIEDCYAVLRWLDDQAAELGIDTGSIGVMGESAGGGLAASLALLVRDRSEHCLAFQHLVYPMIDDRTCIAPEPNAFAGEFIWTPESNRFGWSALLGEEPGGDNVSHYAAAARAVDVSGLPPAFISTGALDLFIDENIEYARRLIRAGVPTEFHVYPGAYHGFHFVAEAQTTLTAHRDSMVALKTALASTSSA